MNFLDFLKEKIIRNNVVQDGKKKVVFSTDNPNTKVVFTDTGLPREVKKDMKEKSNRKKGQIKAKGKKKAKEQKAVDKKKKSLKLKEQFVKYLERMVK